MKNRSLRLAAVALLAAFVALPQSAQSNVCRPRVLVTGTTCLGDTITITMAGHADCKGCLVGSLDPGPTMFRALAIPVGSPNQLFIAGLAPKTRTLKIPNDPVLQNASFYLASVLTDGNTVSVSRGVRLTICP